MLALGGRGDCAGHGIMNHARIAQLLREHARITTALADEFQGEAENDSEPKRRVPIRAVKPPVNPPSEVDRARAQQQLKRLGYRRSSR